MMFVPSHKRPNFIQCFIPSRNIRLLTGDCLKMASHKLCVDICIVTCVSVLEALGAQITNSKSFGSVSPFSVVILNPDECRLAAGLASDHPTDRSGRRQTSVLYPRACFLLFRVMPAWLAIFSVANQLSRNRPGEPTRPHSRTMAHSPKRVGAIQIA